VKPSATHGYLRLDQLMSAAASRPAVSGATRCFIVITPGYEALVSSNMLHRVEETTITAFQHYPGRKDKRRDRHPPFPATKPLQKGRVREQRAKGKRDTSNEERVVQE